MLAPTVNLHRSPLAGRNFECYSEDPLLSGRLAAAYVRGVQSNGVFATVKHFVGNDAEFERGTINSVIDERALRELYLLPFEMAIREGGALAIMTAYNRLNGRWLTQQPQFLLDILREEWGFEGLVMTDWFAVAETATSLGAGLDLEMPGPGRALGPNVVAAVRGGEVAEADLDAAVFRLLFALDRIGVLDVPEPAQDLKVPDAESLLLLRQAAAESMVLLSNDGLLPLPLTASHRIAVIGPHAIAPSTMGGGSAQVTPYRITTPLDDAPRPLRCRRGDRVRAWVRSLVGPGRGGRGRATGAGRFPGRAVCRTGVRGGERRDGRAVKPAHGVVRQPGAGNGDRGLVHARRRHGGPRGERHVPTGLGSGRLGPSLRRRSAAFGRFHQSTSPGRKRFLRDGQPGPRGRGRVRTGRTGGAGGRIRPNR